MRTKFWACGLVVVVLQLMTCGVASAQWTWATYQDNATPPVTRNYPRWKDIGNNKVTLENSAGIIQISAGSTVTDAEIWFYRSTGPMQWEAFTHLKCVDNAPQATANPPPGYAKFAVAWGDSTVPKKQFTKGISIKMEIKFTKRNNINLVYSSHTLTTQYCTADPF